MVEWREIKIKNLSNKSIIAFVLICATIICGVIIAFSIFTNDTITYTPIHTTHRIETGNPQDTENQEQQQEPKEDEYVIPKDEWYLKLVNRDNPITAEYEIPVTAIDSNGYYFDERGLDMLYMMLEEGEAAGMKFRISSGYRTLERQEALYNQAVKDIVATGKTQEEAAELAAVQVLPPGTSEHNLGLCVDIVSSTVPATIEAFEQTEEFAWLIENAKKYGFILRYPKEKEDITKVLYEPWHFRFVGSVDAKRITEQGVCLEEYLA